MDNDAAKVGRLLRQLAAVAGFGSFALRQTDLQIVLAEAARSCAAALNVPFAKVCRYREAEGDLLVQAGFGWQAGVVGRSISRADATSPQGRAFVTGKPMICKDLRLDNEFELPAFYGAHGIISTVDVVIKGEGKPYGILEIDNNVQHDYDQQDVDFLTGFANVLAEAVATSERTALLRATIEQMRALVVDKDRLLDQKHVLAQELQHRVRNNLQLVYGMLSRQVNDTADEAGQRGLKAIARRVFTLAQVYDHLLGNELTRATDFGAYVKSLCTTLAEFQPSDRKITLVCESEALPLDLDTVTALGIVVAELVSNIYEHAFPDGTGSASVTVRRAPGDKELAVLTVSDTGTGFPPPVESKRHGLGLVRRLVEQTRGRASVERAGGTAWTIVFPAGGV